MTEAASRTCCAYYRTSSATNVGVDKDSLERQRLAVASCARYRGLTIVREFYDAAVSGSDSIQDRAGFSEMMGYMQGNGARTIVVESASRFARDMIVQETGYHLLKKQGIELIAADAPEQFLSDTPSARLIRQILGAVAEFERYALVTKLRGARDRKRRLTGRCEGNPAWRAVPMATVELAQRLRAGGYSLREVARGLEEAGHVGVGGRRYTAGSVVRMLRRETRITAASEPSAEQPGAVAS